MGLQDRIAFYQGKLDEKTSERDGHIIEVDTKIQELEAVIRDCSDKPLLHSERSALVQQRLLLNSYIRTGLERIRPPDGLFYYSIQRVNEVVRRFDVVRYGLDASTTICHSMTRAEFEIGFPDTFHHVFQHSGHFFFLGPPDFTLDLLVSPDFLPRVQNPTSLGGLRPPGSPPDAYSFEDYLHTLRVYQDTLRKTVRALSFIDARDGKLTLERSKRDITSVYESPILIIESHIAALTSFLPLEKDSVQFRYGIYEHAKPDLGVARFYSLFLGNQLLARRVGSDVLFVYSTDPGEPLITHVKKVEWFINHGDLKASLIAQGYLPDESISDKMPLPNPCYLASNGYVLSSQKTLKPTIATNNGLISLDDFFQELTRGWVYSVTDQDKVYLRRRE